FTVALQVYGRQGRPCPTCGQDIAQNIIGGRSSFFCPKCQK
ncbi:MAG: formamidopyrimidine-DNA glycosylase, partial [Lentisphaeria bacterium]|nr:formamidopyrimidine-DNA glycosylase [Lentisphaeria bacterium]